jgi:hypothetical protein
MAKDKMSTEEFALSRMGNGLGQSEAAEQRWAMQRGRR